MNSKWYMSVILAVLCIVTLIAAVVLQLDHSDASKAWEAFGGLVVFFGGVHVKSPVG